MNRTRLASATLAIAIITSGCSNITTGNDPVVVNAERTIPSAHDVINAFLKTEAENHATIKANTPQISAYANYIRANFPHWNSTAWATLDAYQQNRTAQNKANLATALAVLAQAVSQAQTYLTQINSHQ